MLKQRHNLIWRLDDDVTFEFSINEPFARRFSRTPPLISYIVNSQLSDFISLYHPSLHIPRINFRWVIPYRVYKINIPEIPKWNPYNPVFHPPNRKIISRAVQSNSIPPPKHCCNHHCQRVLYELSTLRDRSYGVGHLYSLLRR